MADRLWAVRALALCSVLAVFGLVASAASASGSGLTRAGSAPAAHQLQLVLPLRANITGLERFATAVTSVDSPCTATISRSRRSRDGSEPRRALARV